MSGLGKFCRVDCHAAVSGAHDSDPLEKRAAEIIGDKMKLKEGH